MAVFFVPIGNTELRKSAGFGDNLVGVIGNNEHRSDWPGRSAGLRVE
jgi:hypothetical protein